MATKRMASRLLEGGFRMSACRMVSLLVAGLFVASAAGAWTLAPCPGQEALSAQTLELLKAARPGTSLYAPQPYPQSAEEAIENFEYRILEVWGSEDGSRFYRGVEEAENGKRRQDRRMASLIKSGKASYSVARLDNWELKRCSSRGPSQYYYLVVVSDENGAEFGRGLIDERGRLIRGVNYKEQEPHQFPELQPIEASEETLAGLGLAGESAQYVATSWLNGECQALSPCVARKTATEVLLVTPKRVVYRVPLEQERLSFSGLEKAPLIKAELLAAPERAQRPIVSLGGDVLAIAERLN